MLDTIDYNSGDLKEFYNIRDKLILHLLWETGGRVGDIARLKVTDFDVQKRILHMYVKKRKMYLDIPLSDEIMINILNYLSERNKRYETFHKNMLFDLTPTRLWQIVIKCGDKLNEVHYKTMKTGKTVKQHIHPHMFRHGLAIHLLQKGIPIPVIAARLGHASSTTTMRYYLVITPDLQRQIITPDKLKD
jgi:integrase/recombinase XerD